MRLSRLRLDRLKPLAQRWINRPWQCLLLLMLGLPFAWAAGVSINNMVITTVKQLAFGQARAEVMVGSTYTQPATVRLSPGAVSYRSSNPQVAAVNAQSGQVSGVLAGEATIFADQAAAPPYPAASASYTIKVKGKPVVFNAWALPPVSFGAQPYQISPAPSSNSQGAISYSLQDPNNPVVSITAQGLITVKAVGKTTIIATQAPSGSFEGGSTQAVLEVTKSNASFTWPAQRVRLGSTLDLTDPTDSLNTSGAFSYAVKPDAQGRTIAEISGKRLTPLATGSTTLTVTQAASANYAQASLDVTLTVEPASFAITGFTVPRLRYDAVDPRNNQFTLTEPAKPQGSQSSYTFTSNNEAVASVSGTLVTVHKPGTADITATLPADPARHDAASASATLTVDKALPAIGLAAVNTDLAAGTVKINLTSNSDGTLNLSLQNAQPADFASLSQVNGEWIATLKSVGQGMLVATQAASNSGVFDVGNASARISVTAQPLLPNPLALASFDRLTTDMLSFKPPWTGAVGDLTAITVTSSDTSVATVGADKQTLTLTGKTGPTTLRLTQPASATHASADLTATMTVRAGEGQPATLYFTPNVIAKTFGDVPFTPEVFNNSDALPKFSIAASDSGVAQVDGAGRQILIVGAGTATITATVSSANFKTTTATATLNVSARDPNLSLSGSLLRAVNAGPFDLSLSTLSAGALSVSSSDTSIATATVSGTPPGSALTVRVTPLKAGKVTLTLHQDAASPYKAADLRTELNLSAPQASINWPLPSEFVLTSTPTNFPLPAATSSNTGTPITYALSPRPNASLSGQTLTLGAIGSGSVTLTANQAAGNGYAATTLSVTVPVVGATSGNLATTVLTAPDTVTASVGDSFTIPFQTNSDVTQAPVLFQIAVGAGIVAIDSSDPSGHTLKAQAPGEATVLLSQKQTTTHSKAEQVVKVTVMGSDPIIRWQDPIEVTYDVARSTIDIPLPQSRSTGTFSYSVDPSGPPIAEVVTEVNASRLHLKGAGQTTLFAQQAANGPYPSDTIGTRLIVHAQPNSLAFNTQSLSLDTQGRVVRYPNQAPTFTVTASSTGPSQGLIGYSSSRLDVATISPSGLVTIQPTAPGKETVLTATQEAWQGIAGAQAQLVLKVEAAAPTLSLLPFTMPLGSTRIPPYTTSDPTRAVEVSVSDPTYASVGADKQGLTALREGTVRVTVTHPPTTTQSAVSVSTELTITARAPTLRVTPASINHTWTGAETTITLVPSSDNASGAYTLTSSNTSLASVNGLQVTLKAPANGQSASTSLWLTQAAGNGWSSATLEIPVQVNVVPAVSDLNGMTRRYGEPNFDLPATLNGQSVSYTSLTTSTASIVNGRTVQLNAVGSTRLQARNAANALVKEATLTVTPGDPGLALQNLNLASTTLEQQLQASRKGDGAIGYSLLEGTAAEVRPNGLLLVKGPGTVKVQATVPAAGNYDAASTTALVTIADGVPGLVITDSPTTPVELGQVFEVGYRTNFVLGEVNAALLAGNIGVGELVERHFPAQAGERGYFRFRLSPTQTQATITFHVTDYVADPFSSGIGSGLGDSRWTRNIPVNFPSNTVSTGLNLGPEIVLTYNPDNPIALPKTLDAAGNPLAADDPRNCGTFTFNFKSSNTAVLGQLRKPPANQLEWYMTGVGQTSFSCSTNASPDKPRPVLVTVLPASPELQGFDAVSINLDAQPLTLTAPSSLNTAGVWSYQVVNDDPSQPPVATIENGRLVPRNPGGGQIIATQTAAPGSVYQSASIGARLTVNPITPKSFGVIYATYGDPAFDIPRPANAISGELIGYRLKPANTAVAEIVNGAQIQVKAANLNGPSAEIEAVQRGQVIATATLVVDKAQTRLVFRMPTQAFFVDFCSGSNKTLPVANQGESTGPNAIRGTLETNNPEGLLRYNGVDQTYLSAARPVAPQPPPYYWYNVFARHADLRQYALSAEQLESANYYGARTGDLFYFANSTPQQCPL